MAAGPRPPMSDACVCASAVIFERGDKQGWVWAGREGGWLQCARAYSLIFLGCVYEGGRGGGERGGTIVRRSFPPTPANPGNTGATVGHRIVCTSYFCCTKLQIQKILPHDISVPKACVRPWLSSATRKRNRQAGRGGGGAGRTGSS